MKKAVIGISAYYHDSAACLLVDGKVIAAAQEERFSRLKHDESFPIAALKYCIEEGMDLDTEISCIAFYEKPYIKFERLLETYHAFAPRGVRSYLAAIPSWIKEKLFIKGNIEKELKTIGISNVEKRFPEHHLSHAASAFYPSPFEQAAILTLDGVGEWATTTIAKGSSNSIEVIRQLDFPHSLGLLYSAFTYYCGFRVNSGEYKLMGLAPYGDPDDPQTIHFQQLILDELVDVREDGSFLLNMKYFDFATSLRMTNKHKWEELFGIPRRLEEDKITKVHMNLALAIQRVTEKIVVLLASTAKALTGCQNLVMSGGVALNCVSNSRVKESCLFENIWIQPASGDSGGAVGAALAAWHIGEDQRRNVVLPDGMQGAFLGPEFSDDAIRRSLRKAGAVIEQEGDIDKVIETTAKLLQDGSIVGWFQGRMEFGPRALGNRSILADPRDPMMQRRLNLKIKKREGFRPFAPSVCEEDAGLFFEGDFPSPYMLFTMPVVQPLRVSKPAGFNDLGLIEKCYVQRSAFPSITHIDYSSRVQTVSRQTNPRFWNLLDQFKKLTGTCVLINTSFNVRGEPIVHSPEDAYRCFCDTDMDYLVMGSFLLDKKKQPARAFLPREFEPD